MGCYLSIVKIYGDRATLGRVEKWGEVGKSVNAKSRLCGAAFSLRFR